LQQRNRVRPALLQAEVTLRSDDDADGKGAAAPATAAGGGGQEGAAGGGAEDEAQLRLVLWRADAITAVIELDKNLSVVRADPAAGLLFGLSSKLMIKKDFRR
jgi:hypothetical protein